MSGLFPTRALAVLIGIGFVDLVATATLHARGQIVELNPVMAPLLAESEIKFIVVKSTTLVAAWIILAQHARVDRIQVRIACLGGSAAYLGLLFTAICM